MELILILVASLLLPCTCTLLNFKNTSSLLGKVRTNEIIFDGDTEDAHLNFTELTAKYGYATQEHTVITKDGYILTLFRIPKGRNCNASVDEIPVILQHGLIDSSDTFIVAGPGVGLAYILADACYDVWCPNTRGNLYSRRHVTLDPNSDSKYWNFTFDQHGMFDLPAIVDFVLEETKSKTLNYIGHSQGSANFFILTSSQPQYNDKFQIAICLAPAVWLHHMFSPTFQILAKASPAVMFGNSFVGSGEIFGRSEVSNHFEKFFCKLSPVALCGSILLIASGLNPKTLDHDTLLTVSGHYPCATSTNNILHFAQAVNVNRFRRFDYGEVMNWKVYGTNEPPDYDVSKVSAPVALVTGMSDWLVSSEDIDTLKINLPNVVNHYIVPQDDWSHLNFVWGKSIPEMLSSKIFEYLKMFS